VLYSFQKELQEEARTVRLSWIGNGVLFDVSTDNGKTWQTVENGEITRLKNPGRKIVVKALLPIDAGTALDSYVLEVNPAGYSLFTGKVLEGSTGLVYFGARWYDPEVGRFISVDPAEDGENWYAYCEGNPANYIDQDGRKTTIYIHNGENLYGHTSICVNGKVYSYGRYHETYPPFGLRGAGILMVQNESWYIKAWSRSNIIPYEIKYSDNQEKGIDDFIKGKIKKGKPHPDGGYHINTYNIRTSNCTTLTIKSIPWTWWKLVIINEWTPVMLDKELTILDPLTDDITKKPIIKKHGVMNSI
jgi:RHS repeat-associated protein